MIGLPQSDALAFVPRTVQATGHGDASCFLALTTVSSSQARDVSPRPCEQEVTASLEEASATR